MTERVDETTIESLADFLGPISEEDREKFRAAMKAIDDAERRAAIISRDVFIR